MAKRIGRQRNKRGGLKLLVADMLIVAVEDWRCASREARSFASVCGFETSRQELRDFWYGRRGQILRDAMGIGELRIEELASRAELQRRTGKIGG